MKTRYSYGGDEHIFVECDEEMSLEAFFKGLSITNAVKKARIKGVTEICPANASLQIATPDHLRGRVMAIYMLLFAGSTPIGGFLTGYMAEHLGVSTAIAINAGACGIGVAAGLLYFFSHRTSIANTSISIAPA